MYETLGVCLALAALLVINALVSLLIAALWRVVARFADSWSAVTRAQTLFMLRTLPAAAALSFVVLLLLPAYVVYEPRATSEKISLQLILLAVVSVICIVLAVWRGFACWYATRRLVADWMRHAAPVRLANVSLPVYRIRHQFPVLAVVGALRPRLFIASQLFDSLSDAELAAALAHERGHLYARDNLKRVVMRVCRDMLAIVPCGRGLDKAWKDASEAAADERATQADSRNALELAAALVKIARLAPLGAQAIMPVGAFLLGDEHGSVTWRVRRLVQLAAIPAGALQQTERDLSRLAAWSWRGSLCGLFFALISITAHPQTLASIHTLTERIVAALR
ncbi:MAG: M48 family metalloprotease [Pyrinomonadaceae bacterium]